MSGWRLVLAVAAGLIIGALVVALDQRCAAKGMALAAAEPRLPSLLSTHLWFPGIARELFPVRSTVKSEANSICRKLGASSRSQVLAGRATAASWKGDDPFFMPPG